jgi:hypothetical protein
MHSDEPAAAAAKVTRVLSAPAVQLLLTSRIPARAPKAAAASAFTNSAVPA